jgi:hypothetical protein
MPAKELDAEFGIAGVLDFLETESGLVKAAISLGGISGELYLQGAQVTAWQPPGERPILFTSPNAVFAPGKAVRGGIPIIFPWFGPNRRAPSAPQHGIARIATWQTLNRPSCPCRRIVGSSGERSFAQRDSAVHANWSSSAFASFKSGLSKPSVNQL